MTESTDDKKKRVKEIIKRLEKEYPDARVLLDYSSPLELLVATILAAQCTDARVNQNTPAIFKQFKTAKDYADAPLPVLEKFFKPCGFFRNKSKAVKACCQALVENHGGSVPDHPEALYSLPGVGRKTANVALGNAFGRPAVIVDTHVLRVSGRLGLASEKNVKQKYADKIEQELMEITPEKQWTHLSHLLSFHGRRICVAAKPKCPICPVNDLCPYPNKTKA
ncbi:MAG TPA: endonuclease III [Planctomycetota bacterium]|nr:endonuclease III [Planctomycetota bacterium]